MSDHERHFFLIQYRKAAVIHRERDSQQTWPENKEFISLENDFGWENSTNFH